MSQHGKGLRASADSRWTSVKYTPGAKYRWKSWAGSLNTELTRWYNVDHDTLIHEVSRSHTTTHHSRQDSSGRVISPSQRPLPDNTQHNDAPQSTRLLWTSDQPVAETSTWQHTKLTTDEHLCPPPEFEHTIPAGQRPHIHALDRTATWMLILRVYIISRHIFSFRFTENR